MERRTIKALRRAAAMTQRDLAARIGVSKTTVSYWETARNEPSARQLRALATVLGVPMEGIAFERDAARTDAQEERR